MYFTGSSTLLGTFFCTPCSPARVHAKTSHDSRESTRFECMFHAGPDELDNDMGVLERTVRLHLMRFHIMYFLTFLIRTSKAFLLHTIGAHELAHLRHHPLPAIASILSNSSRPSVPMSLHKSREPPKAERYEPVGGCEMSPGSVEVCA